MTSSTARTPETGEAQAAEAQVAEAQAVEPRTGTPHAEAPHTEAPHAEAPHVEAPHTEAPHVEAPHTLAVSVNGERRDIPRGLTLDRLVATLTEAPSGVAAAVNEAVVPRGEWSARPLAEGDRVEVLTAVQGG